MHELPDHHLVDAVRHIEIMNEGDNDSDRDSVGPEDVIVAVPAELFRPPHWLAKTAGPSLTAELGELLDELRLLQEEHVGERVIEVFAYYGITGAALDLQERFRSWAERYCRERANSRHIGPAVRNDPFQLFLKLVKEWDSLVGRIAWISGTVPGFLLRITMDYVLWLLYTLLWRDLIDVSGGLIQCIEGYQPATEETIKQMVLCLENNQQWNNNTLASFLCRLAQTADAQPLTRLNAESDTLLLKRLGALAAECQEMRQLLLRNFHSHKTIVSWDANLAIAWYWAVDERIAILSTGKTPQEVRRNLHLRESCEYLIGVGHDGLLFDWRAPWLRTHDFPTSSGIRSLVLNCYLLECFHQRLYGFYDRIDFASLRQSTAHSSSSPEQEREAVAATCQRLAQQDDRHGQPDQGHTGIADLPEVPPAGFRAVRSLRSEKLLRQLTDRFGCHVRNGKGSEIVVHRPGGKVFRLGHHKRNGEVHSLVVQRMLHRLGIDVGDWVSLCIG